MSVQDVNITSVVARSPASIVLLCSFLILFDGYDLVVYGAVAPALLHDGSWGATPGIVGRIASLTLLGMLLGAMVAGTLADRIGRRLVILGSLVGFSSMMILSGTAQSLLMFEVGRFLAGLGLGALLPTVTALIIEFSPPSRRAQAYSMSFLGYLVGGMISGLLGVLLIDQYGWRPLMLVGGLPLILLPLFIRYIPESPEWLATRDRQLEADAIADRYGLSRPTPKVRIGKVGVRALFTNGRGLPTLTAWGIHFCSLLLTFGMVNWLPTIMTRMGYDMRSAMFFSVMLNLGAAIGVMAGARIADMSNVKAVVASLFVIGAAAITTLALVSAGPAVYALVALAGVGTIGTQILSNILVANLYPVEIRGTGLGFSLGVGRIGGMIGPAIGGAILGSGLAPQWNFYVFAMFGFAGCLLALATFRYHQMDGA